MIWALGALLLLCTPTHSSTLSTNNCPANFDLASANVTASSSLDPMVDFFYANLYSSSQQAAIQSAFNSGNSSSITK